MPPELQRNKDTARVALLGSIKRSVLRNPKSRSREICVSDQTWPPSGHLSEPAASVSVQTSDLTKATKLLKPIHLERLPLLQKILFPNGADVSGTLSSEQAKKKNETCDDTLGHLAEKRRNVRSSVSKRSCQLTNST